MVFSLAFLSLVGCSPGKPGDHAGAANTVPAKSEQQESGSDLSASQANALEEVELAHAQPREILDLPAKGQIGSLTVLDSPSLKGVDWREAMQGFASLQTLILARCELTDEDVRLIAGVLPNLRTLNISGNRLTNESLKHVSTIPGLRRLLIGNSIVDETGNLDISEVGLRALIGSRIEFLSLNGLAGVSDKAVEVLLRMKSLQDVDVHRTGLSAEGVERLRKAVPNVRIAQ